MGKSATRHWGLCAQRGESCGRPSSSVALRLFLGDVCLRSLPSAALSTRGVGPGSSPSQPGSCCPWWLSDQPAVHEAVTVLGPGQLQHNISIETPCLLAAPQPPAACCWPGENTGEVSALKPLVAVLFFFFLFLFFQIYLCLMLSEQDGCFLKEILKPSEQENFDQLTRMETSSSNSSGAGKRWGGLGKGLGAPYS